MKDINQSVNFKNMNYDIMTKIIKSTVFHIDINLTFNIQRQFIDIIILVNQLHILNRRS